jgi:hypothetical protein
MRQEGDRAGLIIWFADIWMVEDIVNLLAFVTHCAVFLNLDPNSLTID